MAQVPAFVFFVVCLLFVTRADAQEKSFEDIWTKELRDASQTCRGRLPNALSGEDLSFFKSLSPGSVYLKYIDQPYLFRILDAVLTKEDSQNKALTDVRCLFESPCLIARDFAQANVTLDVCTGASVRFETRPLGKDGLLEGVLQGGNGIKPLTLTLVPTFTDRKSFVTLIACMGDGSLAFVVITNRPGLSAYTRHLIKDHLSNSGFNDNFRITTAYMSSSCKNKL